MAKEGWARLGAQIGLGMFATDHHHPPAMHRVWNPFATGEVMDALQHDEGP